MRRALSVALVFVLAAAAAPRSRGDDPAPTLDPLVELGRRLFYEPCATRTGVQSCADCHEPDGGFSGSGPPYYGDGTSVPRASQTLVDCGDSTAFHWDGAFGSIEDLVTARIEAQPQLVGAGPDDPTLAQGPALAAMNRQARYREAFRATFGSDEATPRREAVALAAFVRTLRATESPYDRYLAGRRHALTKEQIKGLELFEGRAGCSNCHWTGGRGGRFTDDLFHDTGVTWRSEGPPRGLPSLSTLPAIEDLRRQATAVGLDDPDKDPGRLLRTRRPADLRRFKTPSLRDVARRGPYMHDGSLRTLAAVVSRYAEGCGSDPHLDPSLHRFAATPEQVASLVAFLESLSGDTRPGLATAAWEARVSRTRLRFVDGDGKPMPHLRVQLVPAGDPLPGWDEQNPFTIATEANKDGWIAFTPPLRTHVRIELPSNGTAGSASFVPDTCAEAVVEVVPATPFFPRPPPPPPDPGMPGRYPNPVGR